MLPFQDHERTSASRAPAVLAGLPSARSPEKSRRRALAWPNEPASDVTATTRSVGYLLIRLKRLSGGPSIASTAPKSPTRQPRSAEGTVHVPRRSITMAWIPGHDGCRSSCRPYQTNRMISSQHETFSFMLMPLMHLHRYDSMSRCHAREPSALARRRHGLLAYYLPLQIT